MTTDTLPPIVAQNIRDFEILAPSLIEWLGPRLGHPADLHLMNFAYPRGAGMSHETILFEAEYTKNGAKLHQGMVVRIKPTTNLVYVHDQFLEQIKLMQLMHASGKVRVAKIFGVEETPDLLGSPFFVMEQIKGRVAISMPPYAKQGWVVDATPAQRRIMWQDTVTQLAMIQCVPVTDAKFLDPTNAFPDGFSQEMDRWRQMLDWVDPDRQQPLLQEGFVRLQEMTPANRPEGIVWGDSRLGNMMIAEDFTVAAVMDWEQPSLGGALHDLGWWLYSEEMMVTGRGFPPLEGMGTKQETIALWEKTCGKSATDIDWYMAFTSFKMECLSVSTTRLNPNAPRSPGLLGTMTKKRLDALAA